MYKRNRVDDIYCEQLKINAIKRYIALKGHGFDYGELAEHMGMTYKQLRGYIQRLIEGEEIIFEDGVIVLKEKEKNVRNLVQIEKRCDRIIEAQEYIPSKFSKKFKGYVFKEEY